MEEVKHTEALYIQFILTQLDRVIQLILAKRINTANALLDFIISLIPENYSEKNDDIHNKLKWIGKQLKKYAIRTIPIYKLE